MVEGRATRWLTLLAVVWGTVLLVYWWQGRMPDVADELDKARSGKAYGEAKPYVGGGPQPIVIFMADEVGKLLGNLVSVNR